MMCAMGSDTLLNALPASFSIVNKLALVRLKFGGEKAEPCPGLHSLANPDPDTQRDEHQFSQEFKLYLNSSQCG